MVQSWGAFCICVSVMLCKVGRCKRGKCGQAATGCHQLLWPEERYETLTSTAYLLKLFIKYE